MLSIARISRYGLVQVSGVDRDKRDMSDTLLVMHSGGGENQRYTGMPDDYLPLASVGELVNFIHQINKLYPAGWCLPQVYARLRELELMYKKLDEKEQLEAKKEADKLSSADVSKVVNDNASFQESKNNIVSIDEVRKALRQKPVGGLPSSLFDGGGPRGKKSAGEKDLDKYNEALRKQRQLKNSKPESLKKTC